MLHRVSLPIRLFTHLCQGLILFFLVAPAFIITFDRRDLLPSCEYYQNEVSSERDRDPCFRPQDGSSPSSMPTSLLDSEPEQNIFSEPEQKKDIDGFVELQAFTGRTTINSRKNLF